MLLTTLPPVRRSRIVVLSFGTCMMLCSSALAAPTVVARQESEEPEPAAYRAAPLPPPEGAKKSRDFTAGPRPTGAQAQTNVFFLNYDGVTLKHTGDDDAKKNETAFKEFAATYAPYGEGPKREASLQAVRADWAKYNVVITDKRPESGEYTMSVNSPTNVFGGGVLGVAMLDCNDDHAASNVVLAFHSAKDKFSASTQATTMSQEIAHAYGLEHVNEPMDIMNPYNAGGDPSFRDECLKLDSNAKILCGSQHAKFCESKKQNSHQELLWLFGSAEADAVAPVVNIVEPQDGQQFEAPAELTIVVEASDNVAVEQVDILIDGVNQNAPVKHPPYEWKGAMFPPGNFCVVAEGTDTSTNKAMSAPVCFTVVKPGQGPNGGGDDTGGEEPDGATSGGEEPGSGESSTSEAPGTSGGPSEGETSSGGGEDSGDSGEPEAPDDSSTGEGSEAVPPQPYPGTPWFPSPPAEMQDEDGCGCVETGPASGAGALLMVGLGLLRRRRRA